MNKAFTANINDRVTARGYLDENDQLIMLEPEGSGGGGINKCTMTIVGASLNMSAPIIVEFEGNEMITSITNTLEPGSHEIAMFDGGVLECIDIKVGFTYHGHVTLTGAAELMNTDSGLISYTGDFTITVSAPVEGD